jgi:hypothetical protein
MICFRNIILNTLYKRMMMMIIIMMMIMIISTVNTET